MSIVQFSQRVSIPPHVIFRELQGEAVLLNLNSERYYGLDEVGTRFWNVLAVSDSIDQAYQILVQEYDAQPDELQGDIKRLIDELLDQGLIEVVDEGS